MVKEAGLRERKKAKTRQHIADTAARLFALCGYDQVSIPDVARAAEVSDQTVYNYFPLKQHLVLDRADEFRERLYRAVLGRPAGTSPAHVVRVLAHIDLERYRCTDLDEARGEFPALCAGSAAIRRGALEMYDEQAAAVTAAVTETCPDMHPAVARAHAAALVSVFQMITDRTGRSILDGTPPGAVACELASTVEIVLDDLDRHFKSLQHPEPAHSE